eukprot:TRINITY_DN67328_c0_g1_i1.p1 TRINITY_DN67328_c0_g1~~TRINITY_DN67328_c0_g1_i1.p1  ORF type:complete len:360 (+),score=39.13 TRINITY_DN67328_c0_g1_i1:64-1143(+)
MQSFDEDVGDLETTSMLHRKNTEMVELRTGEDAKASPWSLSNVVLIELMVLVVASMLAIVVAPWCNMDGAASGVRGLAFFWPCLSNATYYQQETWSTSRWFGPHSSFGDDMPGQASAQVGNALACQARCQATHGCAHFSCWEGRFCRLQDANAKEVENTNSALVISGPRTCIRSMAIFGPFVRGISAAFDGKPLFYALGVIVSIAASRRIERYCRASLALRLLVVTIGFIYALMVGGQTFGRLMVFSVDNASTEFGDVKFFSPDVGWIDYIILFPLWMFIWMLQIYWHVFVVMIASAIGALLISIVLWLLVFFVAQHLHEDPALGIVMDAGCFVAFCLFVGTLSYCSYLCQIDLCALGH